MFVQLTRIMNIGLPLSYVLKLLVVCGDCVHLPLVNWYCVHISLPGGL